MLKQKCAKKLELVWKEDESRIISNINLEDTAAAAAYLRRNIGQYPNEQFMIIALNHEKEYIGESIVNSGNASIAIVDVTCIIRTAILCGGSRLIVGHNHPNGNCTPSQPDIRLTAHLIQICGLLQIKIQDHVVLGENDYFSFWRDMREIWEVMTPHFGQI